jgi:thymidine kinase
MDNRLNPKKVEPIENIEGIYAGVSQRSEAVAKELYRMIYDAPLDDGKIFMVVGPERSGKSVVAINLDILVDDQGLIGGRRIAFAQPLVDRLDVPRNKIFSRIGKEIVARSFGTKTDIESLFHENEVVVVDEIHFIPADLQSYFLQEAMLFVERGGILVGLGLDYTSQGGEFVFTALLKSRAKKIFRLSSLCQMCGGKADKYCQRLIDGVPASIDTPALLSPSLDVTYEPRCDNCFVIKR